MPSGSRITVTDDGTDGRFRDQRTLISPIFARNNRSLPRTVNPLRVNRTDRRLSLRDLNRGLPTLRPRRLPVQESKKLRQARRESCTDCTSVTLATSADHPRCSVVLASVITRRCTSVSDSFCPACQALSRARRCRVPGLRRRTPLVGSRTCEPASPPGPGRARCDSGTGPAWRSPYPRGTTTPATTRPDTTGSPIPTLKDGACRD